MCPPSTLNSVSGYSELTPTHRDHHKSASSHKQTLAHTSARTHTLAETWRRVWGTEKIFNDIFRKKIQFYGPKFLMTFLKSSTLFCLPFLCLYCLKSDIILILFLTKKPRFQNTK